MQHSVRNLLEYFSNYQNITPLVLFFGKHFVQFHKALQSRAIDFTKFSQELDKLKFNIQSTVDEEFYPETIDQIYNFMKKIPKNNGLKEIKKLGDHHIRISDALGKFNRIRIKHEVSKFSKSFLNRFLEIITSSGQTHQFRIFFAAKWTW